MKTFVIAEAGANHNRDWTIAASLIRSAAKAGASAVKFQSYTSKKLYVSAAPDFGVYKNIPELISSIELPREWHADLKKACEDYNIEFMSTPFDEDAVDLLYKLGVKRLKVASFESSDRRLLKLIADTKLPVIFSAGIGMGVHQVKDTIDFLRAENADIDITVLHCNSSYPTPFTDINLGQMLKLKLLFGSRAGGSDEPVRIGLSDHTEGILVPPIAVTHGAEVIEKHFTFSRCAHGPDHGFAIEPYELEQMCDNIRSAELVMGTKMLNKNGDSEVSLTASEMNNQMSYALRSIVAKSDIRAGDLLTESRLTTKRPFINGNIPAREYWNIVDKNLVAAVDIKEDTMLTGEMVMHKS